MTETKQRVDPKTVHERMLRSDGTWLVCAYDDDEKCRDKHIAGAITLSELKSRSPAKDRRLVFYCG